MDLSKRIENMSLGEMRKCPRCGETKNAIEDFHKGTSMCKDCKKDAYMNKRGPTISNSDMLALIKEMAVKMEKMERALKRHKIELSEDEDIQEKLNKPEKVKKTAKKSKKKAEIPKNTAVESEKETEDDSETEPAVIIPEALRKVMMKNKEKKRK